jgi:HSP20 family protein
VQVGLHAWGSSFDHLANELWAMMNEMESQNYFRSHAPDSWRPRMNLYETREAYIACLELAGMPRERIEVRADQGTLYIRGVRQKPAIPADDADVSVHLMEIDSGRFHRELPIPTDVDADAIRANYRHGYLWILLPRAVSGEGNEDT